MEKIQKEISKQLKVHPKFQSSAEINIEINRRLTFIKNCLTKTGMKTLVLGISGGIDSLTAGMLSQKAVEQLRTQTGNVNYRFIAVRLPYNIQHDEKDAKEALATIKADEEQTVNIGPSVKALVESISFLKDITKNKSEAVIGNIKARTRMVAQYAITAARGGLVVGTCHAAEALMGLFAKYGDSACDIAPLYGLTKGHIREIARMLGAPEHLVTKIPTADLVDSLPGYPDESLYNVTYAEIDAFLTGTPQVKKETFNIIINVFNKTKLKREHPLIP